jgi:hypothetical protein
LAQVGLSLSVLGLFFYWLPALVTLQISHDFFNCPVDIYNLNGMFEYPIVKIASLYKDLVSCPVCGKTVLLNVTA